MSKKRKRANFPVAKAREVAHFGTGRKAAVNEPSALFLETGRINARNHLQKRILCLDSENGFEVLFEPIFQRHSPCYGDKRQRAILLLINTALYDKC